MCVCIYIYIDTDTNLLTYFHAMKTLLCSWDKRFIIVIVIS